MTAPMSSREKDLYQFGQFHLDAAERLLLRDGQPIQLTPKAFDMLLLLVRNSGHVLAKQELLRLVWPDTFVEENTLTHNISALRKALGDRPDGRPFIETVPKVGYRFEAPVTQSTYPEGDLIIERRSTSHLIVQEDDSVRAPRFDLRLRSRISTQAIALLSLAAAILSGATFLWMRKSPSNLTSLAGIRSIAVLPFKSIGGQEADQYLGFGFTDALITRLGSVKQITVRPTGAVQKFGGGDQDLLQAGRELGVESVLDGHLQRSGDTIRVTVQLVSVKDGVQLWTATLDGKLDAIFSLQDSISSEVAHAMKRSLNPQEKDFLTREYGGNSDAYMACLKGRFFWNKRTPDGFKRAIESFMKAIEIDPDCALAYIGLADCGMMGAGIPNGGASMDPKVLAARALQLDDTLAEAHTTLAYYESAIEWNWEGAEQEFRRALDLNPGYATAHHWHAYNLASMGRSDEAIAEMKRAQEIDPLSLIINTDLGHMLYLAGRFDEAIAAVKPVIDMDPNFAVAHQRLGETYIQKGLYEDAINELENSCKLADAAARTPLGHAYGRLGEASKAAKVLADLEAESRPGRYTLYYDYAVIFAGLGDKDRAFECLGKACESRTPSMALFKLEPMLESLRSDRRYATLLGCMGLKP